MGAKLGHRFPHAGHWREKGRSFVVCDISIHPTARLTSPPEHFCGGKTGGGGGFRYAWLKR